MLLLPMMLSPVVVGLFWKLIYDPSWGILNYALGLTRVRFSHYLAASWIGMLPGTLLFVYLGSLARAGLRPEEKTPLEWGIYGVGLAATIGVTIMVTRMARNAMRKQADLNQ